MWLDSRFIDLVGIRHPIIQAPMVGQTATLAASVSAAGGLGSLACATLTPDQVRSEVSAIRQRTDSPFNVNFFCHTPPAPDEGRDAAWRKRLAPYYSELGLDPDAPSNAATRAPFDARMCEVVTELRPKVVSFHFGLPEEPFLEKLRKAGCLVLSSATTVEEARWLEARGVDAVIAQGSEAGGHRGMFLTDEVASQVGTFALVPQIADAIRIPVVAAGGIADGRGIAAAFALGASAVQMGTAFLFCPEAKLAEPHRAALKAARDDGTALTNVFTGRPARGLMNRAMRDLGVLCAEAPAFPLAATALQPLRTKSEALGSDDFTPLWSGQSASLCREKPAEELIETLVSEALEKLPRQGRGLPA